MYADGAKQLLEGCDDCKGRFFYFMRKEAVEKQVFPSLTKDEVEEVEKDIRELIGDKKVGDKSIILDIETIRVLKPGKYLIDLTNAFSKDRPIIYKIKDGKYYIDLSSIGG
jgi:predicted  nucleic acid-binding Zn-ribbon protein